MFLIIAILFFGIFLIYQVVDLRIYSKKVTNEIMKTSVKAKTKIPILMYHSISNEPVENPMIVDKAKFNKEMKYLKDNRYNVITLDQLYEKYIKGTSIPEKSIVITFDDGYSDNYKNAYPILKKYNFKATIFVITSYIGKGKTFLNINELKQMQNKGIDIQSHTVRHKRLDRMTYKEQLYELKKSKQFLEKNLNKKVQFIAYPFGQCNKDTIKIARKTGYKMGLSSFNGGRWSEYNDGIYTLDRVYISSNHTFETFKQRITNPKYSFIYLRDISFKIKVIVALVVSFIIIIVLLRRIIKNRYINNGKTRFNGKIEI